MNRARILIAALTCGVLVAGAAAAAPPAAQQSSPLASGPYSAMHMQLSKTILGVNVARVTVRFDQATQRRFAQLAGGQSYSPKAEDAVASVATQAQNALVTLRFQRDVSLKQFLDGVQENLQHAYKANLITRENYTSALQRVPSVFAVLKNRGFKDGDTLYYRVYPDRLQTVVKSSGGQVLINRTDQGAGPSRNVMASYFAPKSDFRKPLIRSLFTQQQRPSG